MKEKNVSVFTHSLTNGLVLGVALIIFALIMYVFDVERDNYLQYLSYIILFVGQILIVKAYRDKHLDGFISYGKAFTNGFLAGLFASVLLGIYLFLFFSWIAPGEVTKMIEESEQQIIDMYPTWDDEQIDQAMSISLIFMKPWVMAITSIVINTIVSAILALITAAFMKKEEKSLLL